MKKEIIKLNEAEFNAIERGKNYGCVPYWTKISPIRLLRSRANVSLAEAKEAVEFAIKYWKEMSLTWDDYNTNFELWEEAGVDPVPVVKDETAMRWFTTCPCGCQRRFEVIPPVEVTIVPTLDDDAEDPLLGDEE